LLGVFALRKLIRLSSFHSGWKPTFGREARPAQWDERFEEFEIWAFHVKIKKARPSGLPPGRVLGDD
jgi:hypothetical protein